LEDERSIHLNKRTGKTYVSPRIDTRGGRPIRIASKVFESSEPARHAIEQGKLVIRVGEKSRQEIVAKFYEDDRGIYLLTFQKWNSDSGKPYEKSHFSFRGDEVARIIQFLVDIKRIDLTNPGKVNLTDEELRRVLLSNDQARQLVSDNQELFASLVANEITARDVVAVGYRRTQLERYSRLLNDPEYFEAEREILHTTREGVWQRFFEENTWIFGYGLSYIFLGHLAGDGLEHVVRGYSVAGEGKRVDALMKTRALVSSLCFVEIKRHDTPLLQSDPYRSGCYAPSDELAGGVVQVQGTLQVAAEHLANFVEPKDEQGNPTGERLYNYQPRSFLIVGCLEEFVGPRGVNENRFRSFELFRRNVLSPEILTFDELLERARYIVAHS
jgi:hypothetical protein